MENLVINLDITQYIPLVLVFVIIIIASIIIILKVLTQTSRRKEKEWEKIVSLIEQKSLYRAKLRTIEEGYKEGKISRANYQEMSEELLEKMAKLDEEIDKHLSSLAMKVYRETFNEELLKEDEKINYFLKIKKESDELKRKLVRLENQLELFRKQCQDLMKEKQEADNRLRQVERIFKERITDLQNKLDEANKERMRLQKQNQELADQIEMLLKKQDELTLEKKSLEEKVKELENKLKEYYELKPQIDEVVNQKKLFEKKVKELNKEIQKLSAELSLAHKIIEKYRDKIEVEEAKSQEEIMGLVNPKDKAIKKIASEITQGFESYNPDVEYLKAAEKAFYWVMDNIKTVEGFNLTYWMSPEDILETKCADPYDKAVFYCSLLKALAGKSKQCDASVIVVETNDRKIIPLNHITFKDTHIICSVNHETDFGVFSGMSLEEALEKVNINGKRINNINGKRIKRILYEFNNESYETKE
jgi:predicted  nucleic acid-binding Zn-ribbon protein